MKKYCFLWTLVFCSVVASAADTKDESISVIVQNKVGFDIKVSLRGRATVVDTKDNGKVSVSYQRTYKAGPYVLLGGKEVQFNGLPNSASMPLSEGRSILKVSYDGKDNPGGHHMKGVKVALKGLMKGYEGGKLVLSIQVNDKSRGILISSNVGGKKRHADEGWYYCCTNLHKT